MNRNLLKAAIAVLITLVSADALAQETPKWLVGTWVLCQDPDNSPRDSLQFNSDGTGLVIRAKGNTEFIYRQSAAGVSMLANANGYAIPIEMTATEQRDKLLLYSDKTKNTATYVRDDSPAASTCTIK